MIVTSKLVEHARRELQLIGEDPDFAEAIVKAVEGFCTYRHSGGSASVAAAVLERLLRFEALAPLTSDPDDWEDRSEYNDGKPIWQNRRDSRALSGDGGKTWWYVDGRHPGERTFNGDEPGVLVYCGQCSGDGLLHQPDEFRPGPAPQESP